jgi:pimeloyl-ACP methyl ester carboxylesterase
MPLLAAAGRRVVALDQRGMGHSDRPNADYDMRTVVAEVHEFSEVLGVTAECPIDVVGHDVGTWIGYAYAAEWASDLWHLAVFDAAFPGIHAAGGIPRRRRT